MGWDEDAGTKVMRLRLRPAPKGRAVGTGAWASSESDGEGGARGRKGAVVEVSGAMLRLELKECEHLGCVKEVEDLGGGNLPSAQGGKITFSGSAISALARVGACRRPIKRRQALISRPRQSR